MSPGEMAKALGGHRVGVTWMARCPAHDDRIPSLSIGTGRDGTVLVRCHAGCSQRDVISALLERGLWKAGDGRPESGRVISSSRNGSVSGAKDNVLKDVALSIWKSSGAIIGSAAETYLQARGITLSLPDSLRFHPGLKHPSGTRWPAMVAQVVDGVSGHPSGIHRTFLSRDGRGKAPFEIQKMMLGPCRGGVVRLGTLGGALLVGEGIETCLAAMQASGMSAWAALSTSGLRSLKLPEEIRDVMVVADGDEPGEAAAQDCARRWKSEGRTVRIARPPAGMDFCDLLNLRNIAARKNRNVR
jgi:putative DNA primase/helicase